MITAVRPMAWGYVRVSDLKQVIQGDSIPEQKGRIEQYYRLYLADRGVDFAGIEEDQKAVSASKRPFHQRESGARLMNVLRQGDMLIIDKMDRLWRNQKDFANLLDWFDKHEIALHIVNMHGMSIDTKNPLNRCFLGCCAAFAELEAKQLSERVLLHNQAARAAGRACSSKPAMGTKHYKMRRRDGKVYTYVEWDANARAVMGEIVRLVEYEGLSMEQVSRRIEQHLAHKAGRMFSKSAFYKRLWDFQRITYGYYCERYIRDHDIKDVTQLPTDFRRKAKAYCRSKGLGIKQQRQRRLTNEE
jgi:DNA invertase Pin-like site-specific DNA recombinase